MSDIEVGNTVTCGICGKETTVQFVTERDGGNAYDLNCMHRNTMCTKCNVLVRDDSDNIQKVEPLCKTCNPEAFDDDE
ncbi:MAG: hypothetical protein ACRD6X_15920 [Pyrinomonadaceae bacterium]